MGFRRRSRKVDGSADEIARYLEECVKHAADEPAQPAHDDIGLLAFEAAWSCARFELETYWAVNPEASVRVHGVGCCETCDADAGREIALHDALVQMPLPHPGCTNGPCSCAWELVVTRDVAQAS